MRGAEGPGGGGAHPSPLFDARVTTADNPGMDRLFDRALHDALELEVDATVERTRVSLAALDTCITLAPLLGIFGTVTGIIGSFNLIGQTAIADPQAVSAGIAEALITTAAGLTIAMPALVAYNLFLTFSDRVAFRLEKYAREFEILYLQSKGLPAVDAH